jgi:hypothetical protein
VLQHRRLKKIQAQSAGHGKPERDNMISSSLVGMHIQFRTLMFHSRPEEQLQERLYLKKDMTSLPAVIRALSSPLGPHPENDLLTNLYSISTPIAIMDESDHRISFNLLTKSAISLSEAIRFRRLKEIYNVTTKSDSPPGTPPKIYLATELYSASALAAHYDEIGPSDYSDLFKSLNT